MIDYIKILKQEEAAELNGCVTAYSICEICEDDCKGANEACTYYRRYLSSESTRQAKIVFMEAIEDFMSLPIRTLLEKKRKAPLKIAETKQITRNLKKGMACHDRKICL